MPAILHDFADWHVEPVRAGFAVVRYEPWEGGLMRYCYSPDGEVEVLDTEAEAADIVRLMRGTVH